MLGFGKKHNTEAVPPGMQMRETLFGDMPWEHWARDAKDAAGHFFFQAKIDHEAGRDDQAVAALRQILDFPELESRTYLQAWHFLRQLGMQPAAEQAKSVRGVVIEVGMPSGVDLLAGYGDGSARYWNFSGAGVVWDAKGDAPIDAAVAALITQGQTITDKIGPWENPRRPAPANDIVRLNMLTPSGLHFGEGPMPVFSRDPMAAPLIMAGVHLMQLLTAKSQQAHGRTA